MSPFSISPLVGDVIYGWSLKLFKNKKFALNKFSSETLFNLLVLLIFFHFALHHATLGIFLPYECISLEHLLKHKVKIYEE